MKFSCHRCKTRYSIADEKVRGKILKVRCKKCSELIVVRERTLTSPNELERGGSGLLKIGKTPRTQSPPPPPSTAETDWFYAVEGRTEGPMLESRLAALLQEGGLPRGAHAWREGMGVWRPMAEIDVFAPYVPEALTAPPPPQPRASPGGEARAVSSVAAPPAFGAPSPAGPPSPTPATPMEGFAPQPTNGLVAFEESQQKLPSLESLADLDGEGPPTLPNQARPGRTVPPPAAPMGGVAPHLPSSAPRTRTIGSDDEVSRKLVLYALPAILVAILLSIVLWIVSDDDGSETSEPVAVRTEIVPSTEEAAPVAAIAFEAEELEFTFEDEQLFDGARHRKKRADKGRKSKPKDSGRRRSAAALDEEGLARGPVATRSIRLPKGPMTGGLAKKSASNTSRLRDLGKTASQGHLPPTLGGPEIMSVIKRHRRGLKQCLERHLKREGADSVGSKKVTISWKVSGSGRASGIRLSHGMGSSVFGKCVKGQLKNWSFPRHRGAPIPVDYPVILTSGS